MLLTKKINTLLRYLVFLLVLTVGIVPAKCNMSSSYIEGTSRSMTLSSKDIDILNEDLIITLTSINGATYDVGYTIQSDSEEGQLALLFDTSVEFYEFTVYLDGELVDITELPSDSSFFVADSVKNVYANYQFFVLDVAKGRHLINVNYSVYADKDMSGWVEKYIFKYNLKPARDWKSFEQLNLKIDASAVDEPVFVTLQDSVYEINCSQEWTFGGLPQDELVIIGAPRGNLSYIVEPEIILGIVFVLLLLIHIRWVVQWRRKHIFKKNPIPIIIGAILVPLISIGVYVFSFGVIDYLIGDYASHHHGYYFLIIFIYPFWVLFYFVLLCLFDLFYKHRLKKRYKRENLN